MTRTMFLVAWQGRHEPFGSHDWPRSVKGIEDGEVLPMTAKASQSRGAVEVLSSKWRMTILHLLTSGPVRANKFNGRSQACPLR